MAVHSGEDIGMAEVTRKRARRLDAPAVISHCSRLVVDPNRGLDNPTLMPEVSDGTVVPGNRALGAAERRARVDTFYHPYHAAIAAKPAEQLAARRWQASGRATCRESGCQNWYMTGVALTFHKKTKKTIKKQ